MNRSVAEFDLAALSNYIKCLEQQSAASDLSDESDLSDSKIK